MQQHKTAPATGRPDGDAGKNSDTGKTGNPRGEAPRDRNEGEGSRSGARAYNDATERFAKSGRVEASGERAKAALEGDEKDELARAEAAGKSRMREEDPAIRQKPARR